MSEKRTKYDTLTGPLSSPPPSDTNVDGVVGLGVVAAASRAKHETSVGTKSVGPGVEALDESAAKIASGSAQIARRSPSHPLE
jgi:hypothetical protein